MANMNVGHVYFLFITLKGMFPVMRHFNKMMSTNRHLRWIG